MADRKEIRKRIGSVQNTRQITRAMKMVAAAKLRRAQEAILNTRPFAYRIYSILLSLFQREGIQHPLLVSREEKKIRLVVVAGDRGLCGSFNANVFKEAQKFIKAKQSQGIEVTLDVIGKKANDFFKRRHPISTYHEGLLAKVTYSKATVERLIPVATEVPEGVVGILKVGEDERFKNYIFEPSKEEILNDIVPKHFYMQFFRCVLESVASEHGARMSAMENASKNASEMIEDLTLLYNKARQAAITKELMEIVGGVEAMK
ncbi:MAG: F0F1 ATP synthase subunit gamma [Proteobacteria bacterium]|nr:F0F1 ATP synthase subunit gamma [Pseudomonadota bacterium]